jgi:hypothetical protein
MNNNFLENESPLAALKSESARQRWEMFHRAIAHAKRSNSDALLDDEPLQTDANQVGPVLSIVR